MNERSHSWIDDLKFAMAVGVIVEVVLVDGDRHHAGLHSVDEERGVILLAAPQGDPSPPRAIPLDDIATVQVTDLPWHHAAGGD